MSKEGEGMPRVYLSDKDRLCSRLSRWVYGELKIRRMSQTALAEKMGISHQALSQKLSRESFDFTDFCFFVKEFEPDQKELLELVGY